jgi:hypothetical protein
MSAHVHQHEIERLARRRVSAAESPRVHRHLFECELCLRRLIDAEVRLATAESAGWNL